MKNVHYHFIGIGGISMSGLAKLLYEQGYTITGSDINEKINFDFCDKRYATSFDKIKNASVVVVNGAIPDDDAEFVLAKSLNKHILSRANLLGIIASQYENVIAISGMHGKTSTTEMIAECFIKAGLNPTVHIGGVSNEFNSNLRIGNKKYFITEACEYVDSFLALKPDMAVILNIEPEHLDYFKNLHTIQCSFDKFAKQSKIVIANENANISGAITFGKNANYTYTDVICGKNGNQFFSVWKNNEFYGNFQINSIVQKNIENALACIAVCDKAGIPKEIIFHALKEYKGVKRRMEIINKDPLIIEDYAHHPTEIKATIESVKKFYDKKLIVAFQPHTYSRTQNFFYDFTKALSKADELCLLKTYEAREKEIEGATAKDLYEAIKISNKNTEYYDSIEQAKISIKKKLSKDKILLILGAGDIENLIEK